MVFYIWKPGHCTQRNARISNWTAMDYWISFLHSHHHLPCTLPDDFVARCLGDTMHVNESRASVDTTIIIL